MDENTASRSAAIIAAHRAIESSKPSGERICYDPFAETFIGPDFTAIGKTDLPREQALAIFRQFVPGFHEYFIARTRYIDDYLDACLNNGLQQLVILGAGYDSRAYRFDALKEKISVFEVDKAETQAVKKNKLKAIFTHLPPHVTFVPLDFQHEDVGPALVAKGYDKKRKTVFICEGLTMYLDSASVDKILMFIAGNAGSGSSIIFDFTSPAVVHGTEKRPEAIAWRKRTSDSGEPIKFGIDRDDLEPFIKKRHFSEIACVSRDYFKTAYFAHAEDMRTPTPIFTIAHATV